MLNMSITAGQSRAARGFLNWSQSDLSKHAKVGRRMITHFEAETEQIVSDKLTEKLIKAFEDAGVVFLDSGGIALKK